VGRHLSPIRTSRIPWLGASRLEELFTFVDPVLLQRDGAGDERTNPDT
jgi:hypothetical protein